MNHLHRTVSTVSSTRYEFRTSRTIAAIFSTHEQALAWLQERQQKHPEYAKSLKLFCVTNTIEMTEVA